MAWLAAKIFLSEPPNIFKETCVGAERDEFISYFKSGSARGGLRVFLPGSSYRFRRQVAPLPSARGGRKV